MKPWQLIILAILAVALCVVPWVRAEIEWSGEWSGYVCPDGWGMHFYANGTPPQCNKRNTQIPAKRVFDIPTDCAKKMEQAMRRMERLITRPQEIYIWWVSTEPPRTEEEKGYQIMQDYYDALRKAENERTWEFWATVKQECWTTSAKKD